MIRDYPHPEDIGLNPEADRTEDLRSGNGDAAKAATSTASEPTHQPDESRSSMPTVDDTNDNTQRLPYGPPGGYPTVIPDSSEFDAEREQALLNARLSHIPLPPGVIGDDGWSSVRYDDGDAIRFLTWVEWEAGEFSVCIDGWQSEEGQLCRVISVYGLKEGGSMTADAARTLADALSQAADEQDRLQ
ncbi:hypothetical protein MHPYR_490040 [uncultured Mycobacterium sp.]|uniref:Uncharacterized protein n=1 Tax=uncultured Mycobacterium sp. TaxID=171292 RepID=A0A1Y5PGH0_9MYCO|nr:hypothetical protein MHPYR_490040 [uncultured Mycobacterium sp.]